MAEGSGVKRVYVVDTSYLLELYQVPGHFEKKAHRVIIDRWAHAESDGASFHVTVGCILELGNHIADVDDGRRRCELAGRLHRDAANSVADKIPWLIAPAEDVASLPGLLEAFRTEWVQQQLGLVDAQVIEHARRLAKSYTGLGYCIHIWTKDGRLKPYEPHREGGAFVG